MKNTNLNLKDQLIDFIHRFKAAQGGDPPILPITAEEVREFNQSVEFMAQPDPKAFCDRIFDIPTFKTPFATEMRRISLPVTVLGEELKLDSSFLLAGAKLEELRVEGTQNLLLSFRRRVCFQTTRITVSVECEPWPWLRRLFKKPFRRKEVIIEGCVLYPHLKIALPLNRHYVRFSELPEPTLPVKPVFKVNENKL